MAWLRETQTLWERLQTIQKPVVLYGMGDGAAKALAVCEQYRIRVQGIFASDEFVRGQSFEGFRVERLEELTARLGDVFILVVFGTSDPVLLGRIMELARRYELAVPDLPLFGGEIMTMDYLRRHGDAMERAYCRLADEWSRRVFLHQIEYKLSGKTSYLTDSETLREEVYVQLLPLSRKEQYLDLGAYDGDTVQEFVQASGGEYETILAVEPDEKNYGKLQNNLEQWGLPRVRTICAGIWSQPGEMPFQHLAGRMSSLAPESGGRRVRTIPVESVDHLLDGERVSVIKIDVEGAERQALQGAQGTVERYAPKLLVSAYHRTEDFFDLISVIAGLREDYTIYLRHHPYLPAWETNIYACAAGEVR